MKSSHSGSYIRMTRGQRAPVIDGAKLYKNPKAQGRFSFLGLLVTFLVDLFPYICLFLTPVLLIQYAYCMREDCPEDVMGALGNEFCRTASRSPFLSRLLIFLIIESAFYIAMIIKLTYLQSIDPLEASLRVGGIMSREERGDLWDDVMEAESSDITTYFENWFFGKKMNEISINEIRDFIAFVFFDCRNQEHLTDGERRQLDAFVEDALRRIQKHQGLKNATFNPRNILRSSTSHLTIEPSDFQKNPKDWEKLQVQRRLLQQMVPQAHNIPAAQLAQVMRNITMIHQDILQQDEGDLFTVQEDEDDLSTDSFSSSDLFSSLDSRLSPSDPPKGKSRTFGIPVIDPIHGVRILPLFFQLSIFLLTEVILRIVLWGVGFQRHRVVGTTYYYHPGNTKYDTFDDHSMRVPLVFMHGLGLGQIIYLPLIYEMLKSGRPIFLPEIASVSACRPWIFPGSVQSPHHVAASLSTMLSRHGFAKATFAAHSFGTFWLAYMTKYAPGYVAASVFLDPVCFSLHHSHVSHRMVYNDVDPGSVEFTVLTDMMVNWSIQRLGWASANLSVKDLRGKPCAVFLSEMDRIAPSAIQEKYLRKHGGAKVVNFDQVSKEHCEEADLSAVVFRGDDHGDWLKKPHTSAPRLVECMEALCTKAEEIERVNALQRRQSDRYSMRSSMAILSGVQLGVSMS